MALSNEVVREVRESLGFTIDQVAHLTGFSKSHVHAIEMGYRTPPAEFLSGLHRAALSCNDWRVLQLIDPCITARLAVCPGCARRPAPQRTPPPGDALELLLAEIEANKKHAALLEYMYRIARDGKINADDDKVIADYLDHNNRLVAGLQRTATAVLDLRQRSNGGAR